MTRFVLRRLLTFPLVLSVVYVGAVALLMMTPGDPIAGGEKELSPEVLAQRRAALNYDQHWAVRYFWTWPKRLVWDQDLPAHEHPDWTVAEIMSDALPVSLQLGLFALSLAVVIGTTAGVVAARNVGRWLDQASLVLVLVGVSLPSFVVGAALLMVFGVWFRWVPVGGWGHPSQVFLPALALALPYAAYIARLTRNSLLDVYDEDYIRTARAKGLSETRILLDHAARNAMLPVLSYLGPAAASIFTGSFVVEKIFGVPGVGTHVVESIVNRDQTVILATVMIYSAFITAFNLIVDILYGIVDPRLRISESTS